MSRPMFLLILALAGCSSDEGPQSELSPSVEEPSQPAIGMIEFDKALSSKTQASLKDYRREIGEEVIGFAKATGNFPNNVANVESLAGAWEARIPEVLGDLKQFYPTKNERDLEIAAESFLLGIAKEEFEKMKAAHAPNP